MASTTTPAQDAAQEQPNPTTEQPHDDAQEATETSPLLPPSARDASPTPSSTRKRHTLLRRGPSILALLLLCLLAVLIMVFVFFAPSVLERYAREALVFKPQSLSIDSFTSTGVRARVQGNVMLDSSRVADANTRRFGKFGTWMARYAETGEAEVEVSLPEVGGSVVGSAWVPGVVVDVRDGRRTAVDVVAEVEAGDKEEIRRVVGDWVEGRLGRVRVRGEVEVPIKSGLISLGRQTVRQEMVVEEGDVPTIPDYDIKRINVHEVEGEGKGMEADVSVSAMNEYPVDFEIPPLAFQVLVEACAKSEPFIHVGNAETSTIHVLPHQNVILNATGLVRKLPHTLTQDCPNSDKSPLDILLANYLKGRENTIYIRGSSSSTSETPQWISDLISNIVVPVPLPGKTMGHLIKNFSLEDTHFSLPNPFAEPDTPEAQPRISAKVKALVALPGEMNFNLSANRVRADADVYYKDKKLGKLDLHKWQEAESSRVTDDDGAPALLVKSQVEDAPLKITNDDLFTDVIQDMLFGKKAVMMKVKADVDVEVETALGGFKVRRIPAEGSVEVKKRRS